MKTLQLQISQVELVENKFWKKDIIIKQIKVSDENWKYIKFWKLDKLFEYIEPKLKDTIFIIKV